MSETKPSRIPVKPKMPIVEQISAGGVAFRFDGEQLQIAIIAVNPSRRWQLPKGIIDAGETPEIAAVREVREEAGIHTEILDLIEKIEYWYVGEHRGERVRFHKFVYFYLMKYTGGETANHDHEVVEARFVEARQAIEMLAFKGEKTVVEKAVELVNKDL